MDGVQWYELFDNDVIAICPELLELEHPLGLKLLQLAIRLLAS